MRWLRRFFYSEDPEVKVAAGISQEEAAMWRELLANNGIPAVAKNMNFLSVSYYTGSLANDFDLFVKQSDLERARDLLAPMLEPGDGMPDDEDRM